VMFCCIGIYSINSLPTDIMFIGFFGLVGYALIKFGFEPAPMLLGFVLGKLMEENLRRALIISRGEMITFLDRPISAGLLAVAALLLALALLPTIRKGRDEVFVE
jgi:putative tricarboxylic transport membrane protein